MNYINQRLLQCVVCGHTENGLPLQPPQCPEHPERSLVAKKFLTSSKDYLLGVKLGGKYTLTHPIGQGQFGRVYHALQSGAGAIQRPVAVKVLKEDRPEAQSLFLDEMQVISQLENQYIVRYLDSGFDEEQQMTYLVMEFIEGETLEQHLQDAVYFTPARTTKLIAQLLVALDEAHQAGVIHRDLKPSNLMISSLDHGECLKVLDFGVARPDASQPRQQTQGMIPGTPAYMAPELFCGYDGELSVQMDLFSVGVILYQCLTGHLPFDVESKGENLISYYKLYIQNPKPLSIDSDIPKPLAQIALRALSIDPKRRYPSAQAMLQDLMSWSPYTAQMMGIQIPYSLLQNQKGIRAKSTPRWVWLLAAAFLGGCLGVGAHLSQEEETWSDVQVEEVRTVEAGTPSTTRQMESKSTLP